MNALNVLSETLTLSTDEYIKGVEITYSSGDKISLLPTLNGFV
jgi:hypothetical protein